MLAGLDRIVVAARFRRPVVRALRALLGAEVVGSDPVPAWAAERTTLRAGTSEIEVLEPRGVGAVANFIGRRGPGLFAVGVACEDPEKFRAHLETLGVFFEEHGSQLLLTSDEGVDLPGLNLVVTPAQERPAAGLLRRLCGATVLHREVGPGAPWLRIFDVRGSRRCEVTQASPGFRGVALRFGDGHASHLAILAPWGVATPIAQFFYQYGPGIYCATALSDALPAIRERLGSGSRAASQGEPVILPAHLLGGARLAVFARESGCSEWEVSSPLFDAQRAWA